MIGKEAENKQRGFILENNVLHNAPISDADVIPVLGSIPEGTGSNERLGDRVKPRSLTVRGVIGLNPDYNPNNKPMIATVMLLSAKDKKTNAQLVAAGTAYLLKPNIGGTEQVPWDGSTLASTYALNRDKFKIHYAKQFRLAPGSLASGTREFDYFKWKYTFKSLPATLTWDAETGDDCNNFAPFLVVGWCYTDGTVPPLQPRLTSVASSIFSYEDA